MGKVKEIVGVSIRLEVNDKQLLFILLTQEGLVNRLGDGRIDCEEKDLFIGLCPEPLLSKLLEHITDEMLKYTGGYDIPNKIGEICCLSIILKFLDGKEDGFVFKYGSQSQGPPREIGDLVKLAVNISEPWYQSQIKMVHSLNNSQDSSQKPSLKPNLAERCYLHFLFLVKKILPSKKIIKCFGLSLSFGIIYEITKALLLGGFSLYDGLLLGFILGSVFVTISKTHFPKSL